MSEYCKGNECVSAHYNDFMMISIDSAVTFATSTLAIFLLILLSIIICFAVKLKNTRLDLKKVKYATVSKPYDRATI